MFTHLNLITPVELKTIEGGPKGRVYITPEGKHYPSITTILGDEPKQAIVDWRERVGEEHAKETMRLAAERGTSVHAMIEKFLNNEAEPTAGFSKAHIAGFRQLRPILKRVDNIITQETCLWSDLLRCAGRVDCIGEYKGKRYIIDFKTSTNNKSRDMIGDYFLQTTAYALMFQERYNIQIDEVVILMSVENAIAPLVFTEPVEPHIPALVNRINKYHKKHGTPL